MESHWKARNVKPEFTVRYPGGAVPAPFRRGRRAQPRVMKGLAVSASLAVCLAGRGKMLGGVIVAVSYNGLELLGLGASSQNIWTAVVLLAAVTVDTMARRGRSTA